MPTSRQPQDFEQIKQAVAQIRANQDNHSAEFRDYRISQAKQNEEWRARDAEGRADVSRWFSSQQAAAHQDRAEMGRQLERVIELQQEANGKVGQHHADIAVLKSQIEAWKPKEIEKAEQHQKSVQENGVIMAALKSPETWTLLLKIGGGAGAVATLSRILAHFGL